MDTNITKINVGGTLLPINDPNVCDNYEDGNTASKTYNAGEFIIWKGALYQVTTTIAQGATFTDGVNLEDATITELLKAVKSTLSVVDWTITWEDYFTTVGRSLKEANVHFFNYQIQVPYAITSETLVGTITNNVNYPTNDVVFTANTYGGVDTLVNIKTNGEIKVTPINGGTIAQNDTIYAVVTFID